MTPVSGILLAGGRGVRFRGDKRMARVRGIPLLAWTAALLGSVAEDVVVVTRDEVGLRGRWHYLRDEIPGRGPMCGLLTGLRAIRHQRALVLAVDMPLVTVDFLKYLAKAGAEADITLPRWERIEPLVGSYARSCIPPLAASLEQGRDSLADFVQSTTLTVRFVGEEEVRRFDDPRRLFFNINVPEDVEAAEVLLGGRR
ncbi:MAG: molybdenum cofactor guanylyltransferase [Armatimonadota bacterium]|nr:molybdenum cofactor guanylyltransferase [Armatimonadota bacterium]MDR7426540.1 molybdenum cofactor guanylyltransferase [Armatimonadota bacterium]MDR7471018.1 molybdenum cofactor guanylyltransferase [Armatimonadota bacterium]MDR7474518.1 molybdenum cofactor guanylyltransferase [Armatimonadota bacterium]MDR7540097.1 molybdenum cofactor guanylyltransferase [Armatimonadota bacterium]